jgi:hypothetical protein
MARNARNIVNWDQAALSTPQEIVTSSFGRFVRFWFGMMLVITGLIVTNYFLNVVPMPEILSSEVTKAPVLPQPVQPVQALPRSITVIYPDKEVR